MAITRKRRILIAAGLVLTALFVSWSLGSSGVDKRYVGQWIDNEGTVSNLTAGGHFFLSEEGLTDDSRQRWWVSGDRIVIYSPSPSRIDNAHNWLKYFIRHVTGKPLTHPFEDCRITKFDGDTMQLEGELDLRRVSESTEAVAVEALPVE
jgi:hypothetical protein